MVARRIHYLRHIDMYRLDATVCSKACLPKFTPNTRLLDPSKRNSSCFKSDFLCLGIGIIEYKIM